MWAVVTGVGYPAVEPSFVEGVGNWCIDHLLFLLHSVTSLSDQVPFDIDHIVYIQVTLFIIVELADYHCWLWPTLSIAIKLFIEKKLFGSFLQWLVDQFHLNVLYWNTPAERKHYATFTGKNNRRYRYKPLSTFSVTWSNNQRRLIQDTGNLIMPGRISTEYIQGHFESLQ